MVCSSKYSNFKNELLSNKLCNIENDIYQIAYNNTEYMKTNYIKIIQNRNKNKN